MQITEKYINAIFAYTLLLLSSHIASAASDPAVVKNVELKTDESVVVFNEMTLTLTDIIIEHIAADPMGDAHYPEGSGVTAYLKVKINDAASTIALTKLSPPYESKQAVNWNGYRIHLIDAYNTASISIRKLAHH